MFKNYLKIAWRNLQKNKVYASINICGLAIGIACCFFILLYVQDELSYDRYHKNNDRIYRLANDFNYQGEFSSSPIINAPWGSAIREAFPEVEEVVRFNRPWTPRLVRYQDKQFYEEKFLWVDAAVLKVFSWELQQGDPLTAWRDPFSVVLSAESARRYFGDENPLGKTINLHNQQDYKVTGVLKPIPPQSHFQFQFLASWSSLSEAQVNQSWVYTYFLLHPDISAAELTAKLPAFLESRFRDPNALQSFTPILQPLTDIHLHSHLLYEMEANSDLVYVYIFSVIAVMILAIACFNFMNLSTARSANRAKEVGVRKVLGAYRPQLIQQFLGESILVALLALFLALALVETLMPAFNTLTGKLIDTIYLGNVPILLGLAAIMLVVGVAAGGYPAFFLSRFRPIGVLKGGASAKAGSRSSRLRQWLLVLQFSISIALIAGTLVVSEQLDYIHNARLGFEEEHIVVVPTRNLAVRRQHQTIRSELLQNPSITQVTFATNFPGEIPSMPIMQIVPEGTRREEAKLMSVFAVDRDFIGTLGIELVAGRSFSAEFASDSSAFILNEAAAAALGLNEPLGKTVEIAGFNRRGQVVGIAKDFNFNSLHNKIEPVAIHVGPPDWFAAFALKIRSENISQTLSFVAEKWQGFAPDLPFTYSFLRDDLNKHYQTEEKIAQMFNYFTVLAIFVSCLGLFGLISFTAEQRTKEIGIRKVLGATVAGVVLWLSKDFVKLVLAANLIAGPLAWFAMNRWLENFAYRIEIGWSVFLMAGGLALLIAALTVFSQAIKAALTNPVESLRYE